MCRLDCEVWCRGIVEVLVVVWLLFGGCEVAVQLQPQATADVQCEALELVQGNPAAGAFHQSWSSEPGRADPWTVAESAMIGHWELKLPAGSLGELSAGDLTCEAAWHYYYQDAVGLPTPFFTFDTSHATLLSLIPLVGLRALYNRDYLCKIQRRFLQRF